VKGMDIHLNEDQIIKAVVDQNDLSADERSHLSTCSVCQGKKKQFEQELNNLGRMVKECAPLPERKLIPLYQEPLQKSWGSWFWRPVFVCGVALILLIAGIWFSTPYKSYREYKTAQLIEEIEDDQKFMDAIEVLEEKVLFNFYPDVSGEPYSYVDDEFLEFIFPLEESQYST